MQCRPTGLTYLNTKGPQRRLHERSAQKPRGELRAQSSWRILVSASKLSVVSLDLISSGFSRSWAQTGCQDCLQILRTKLLLQSASLAIARELGRKRGSLKAGLRVRW